MKPLLTIDVIAPEGNVFALVGKACTTLEQAGQPEQATALREWFRTVPPLGGVSYDSNGGAILRYDLGQRETAARGRVMDKRGMQGLLPGTGPLFLITYDYVESGVTERCGFVCHAPSVRAAAESFWNQHPGEWFRLISVNDGSVELFWQAKQGTFVTVPENDLG